MRPVDEERVSVEEFCDYAECVSIVKCQNLKRASFGLILLKKMAREQRMVERNKKWDLGKNL